jgi:hypothetical protein
MTAFPTPRQMFKDQLIEFDFIYQKRKERELDEMQIYALEAEKKIERELKNGTPSHDYIMSVSLAFMEGSESAVNIFKRLSLDAIHAYAVLEEKDYFIEELEQLDQDHITSQYL